MAKTSTKRVFRENANPAAEGSFAAMLEGSFGKTGSMEGTVIKGTVVGIEKDSAVIDVGLKSEGLVPLKEFAMPGQTPDIKIGDIVEVFLERMEDRNGQASLSREKAKEASSPRKESAKAAKDEGSSPLATCSAAAGSERSPPDLTTPIPTAR